MVRRWFRHNVWLILTIPAVAFMVIAFALPLGQMLLRSIFDPDLTLKNFRTVIEVSGYTKVLVNTMRISAIVTVIALVLGYPVAYVLAHARGWAAGLLTISVVLPLWTSELVRTFAWMIVLGRKGPLNTAMTELGIVERPLALLFNEPSVLIGSVHIMLPFMILPLYSVMRGIDRELTRAALSLGATPLGAFRHVYLPLSMSGVVAGCLLVFVLATGFYVTPAALGGTAETMIAQLIDTIGRKTLNWALASALSVVLLVSTTVVLILYNQVFGLTRPIVPAR